MHEHVEEMDERIRAKMDDKIQEAKEWQRGEDQKKMLAVAENLVHRKRTKSFV